MKLLLNRTFIHILFFNGLYMLLSLFSIFYLSKAITVKDFGLFNFYIYVGSFFILFNSLSSELYIVMAVGRDNKLTNQIYNTFFNLRTLFSLILLIGFYLFTLVFKIDFFAFIIIIAVLLNSFLSGHFIPFLRLIDNLNIGLFAQNVQVVIFTLLIYVFDSTLLFISLAYFISVVISVLPVYIYLTRKLEISYIFYIDWFHVKKSLKYFFNQLVDLIYIRLDVFFIQFYFGLQILGIYTAGIKLSNAFLMLPQALLFVFVPDLHKSKDSDKLIKVYYKFSKYIIEIGSMFCICIYFFQNQIIKILFDAKFTELSEFMPLFILNLFIVILNFPNLLLLEIKLMFRKRALIKFASILVLILLLYSLIFTGSKFSVLYAVTLSNCFYFVLSMIVLKDSTKGVTNQMLRSLVAPILAFGVVEFANFHFELGWYLKIMLFLCNYGVLYLLFNQQILLKFFKPEKTNE